jgi:hypothetical protein
VRDVNVSSKLSSEYVDILAGSKGGSDKIKIASTNLEMKIGGIC